MKSRAKLPRFEKETLGESVNCMFTRYIRHLAQKAFDYISFVIIPGAIKTIKRPSTVSKSVEMTHVLTVGQVRNQEQEGNRLSLPHWRQRTPLKTLTVKEKKNYRNENMFNP